MIPFHQGAYRTPPRRIGWFFRTFPSLGFYLPFFWMIFSSSHTAKRGRYGDAEWIGSSLAVWRDLERVGVKFEITGVEHLQKLAGPCVIAGNHMSTLETGLLPSVIQPILPVTFVVKQALIDYPVFKHVMRARNPIAVSTKNAREDLKTMLAEAAERLSRGISVVVFPEGARRRSFDPAEFNSIAVKIAHRAGVPVVPLALMTDAWALGQRVPDIGRIDPSRPVRVAFGEPLWVEGRGIDEHRAIVSFITEKLAQWNAEDGRREVQTSTAVAGAEPSADSRIEATPT